MTKSFPDTADARPQAVTAPRLLTLSEATRATGRNAELLRRWCAGGRIQCRRVGRDWLIVEAELEAIEAMPRRGAARVPEPSVTDLAALPGTLAESVRGCLDPDESVRAAVAGIEGSALVVTDRKALLARDGVLVSDPETGRPVVWRLDAFRRVQLVAESSAGALVLAPRDPEHRTIVVLLSRAHLRRAQAAADAIRRALIDAGARA